MSSLFSSLMGGAPKPSMGARLLERVSTAARLEDKRTALAEFKDVCLSIGGYRCLSCLLSVCLLIDINIIEATR